MEMSCFLDAIGDGIRSINSLLSTHNNSSRSAFSIIRSTAIPRAGDRIWFRRAVSVSIFNVRFLHRRCLFVSVSSLQFLLVLWPSCSSGNSWGRQCCVDRASMEGEKKSSAVSDVGAWAMNVISSVGIIMANKQLMSSNGYAFTFATTLTGFHFAITALVGFISNATGLSSAKHIPLWELLWFSVVANLSITGMNFSLMLNSVGFYQISKLSMIPVVCVLEWILHSKKFSNEVKISVVVVVIGVGVCTVTDVKVNGKGFLCACIAVLSTSLQQISIGSLQKKYSIGSFELLSKTAPIQAASLLVLGPIIDYLLSGKLILDYKFGSGSIIFILLSCSLAVFCNVSQYLCIGRFSAVSFQVLGHMKTVCVLTLGWLLFDSELTLKNISGMIVAIVGMVIYSWAVEVEKQSNSKIISNVKHSLTEEELRLLKETVATAPVKNLETVVADSKV